MKKILSIIFLLSLTGCINSQVVITNGLHPTIAYCGEVNQGTIDGNIVTCADGSNFLVRTK